MAATALRRADESLKETKNHQTEENEYPNLNGAEFLVMYARHRHQFQEGWCVICRQQQCSALNMKGGPRHNQRCERIVADLSGWSDELQSILDSTRCSLLQDKVKLHHAK